jgi:hypothetical protein
VAEVQAKEGAQETAVSLLGLLLGFALSGWLNSSVSTQWQAFLFLTAVHVAANLWAVKVLVLPGLNETRCWALVQRFWGADEAPQTAGGRGALPSPSQLTEIVPVQYLRRLRWLFGPRAVPHVEWDCSWQRLAQLGEADSPSAARLFVCTVTPGPCAASGLSLVPAGEFRPATHAVAAHFFFLAVRKRPGDQFGRVAVAFSTGPVPARVKLAAAFLSYSACYRPDHVLSHGAIRRNGPKGTASSLMQSSSVNLDVLFGKFEEQLIQNGWDTSSITVGSDAGHRIRVVLAPPMENQFSSSATHSMPEPIGKEELRSLPTKAVRKRAASRSRGR